MAGEHGYGTPGRASGKHSRVKNEPDMHTARGPSDSVGGEREVDGSCTALARRALRGVGRESLREEGLRV